MVFCYMIFEVFIAPRNLPHTVNRLYKEVDLSYLERDEGVGCVTDILCTGCWLLNRNLHRVSSSFVN
jgi:hypothetical protein